MKDIMDENLDNYKDLTNLMTTAPQVPAPDNLTQRVMANLDAEQKLSVWQIIRQTFAEAGKISWSNFAVEGAHSQNTFFYFMIAGFFFFSLGSVLFSSTFFINYASRAISFILLQSVIVILAAIALLMGGLMTATDITGTERRAKQAIMIYESLIILSAILIAAVVKTPLSSLFALTFLGTGILTGITLMKALEKRGQGNHEIITGELHNA